MATLASQEIVTMEEKVIDQPQRFSLPACDVLGFTYNEKSSSGYIHYRYTDDSMRQPYTFVVRRADSTAAKSGERLIGSFYRGVEGVAFLVFQSN